MATDAPDVSLDPWTQFSVTDQLDFFTRNREALAPWVTTRPPGFFEPAAQQAFIDQARIDWQSDRGYAFGITTDEMRLAGRITLTNVVRGSHQSAHLGYLVDAAIWGRGVATAAVRLVSREAFETLRLHRIEAAIMPRNRRSLRVVEKCGFRSIGLSARHLQINGVWEDHLLYALTVEDWSPQQSP